MPQRNTIALRTDLSMEECLRRLREGSDIGERTIFSFSGYKGSKPVLSKFEGNQFGLWKRWYFGRNLPPYLHGTLSRDDRGTLAEWQYDTHPDVKLFMYVWLGLMLMLVVPFGISGEWKAMLGSLGILLAGLAMPTVTHWLPKPRETYLREFLETTLAAAPDESGFSLSARTIENKPL